MEEPAPTGRSATPTSRSPPRSIETTTHEITGGGSGLSLTEVEVDAAIEDFKQLRREDKKKS